MQSLAATRLDSDYTRCAASLMRIPIADILRSRTWLLNQAKDADLTDAGTVQSLLPWNAVTEFQTK